MPLVALIGQASHRVGEAGVGTGGLGINKRIKLNQNYFFLCKCLWSDFVFLQTHDGVQHFEKLPGLSRTCRSTGKPLCMEHEIFFVCFWVSQFFSNFYSINSKSFIPRVLLVSDDAGLHQRPVWDAAVVLAVVKLKKIITVLKKIFMWNSVFSSNLFRVLVRLPSLLRRRLLGLRQGPLDVHTVHAPLFKMKQNAFYHFSVGVRHQYLDSVFQRLFRRRRRRQQ